MTSYDSYDEWSVSVDDYGVATLRLLHEKAALNRQGMSEFQDIFSRLPHKEAVEAILITGGERVFCVGLEIQTFVDILDESSTEEGELERRIGQLIQNFHGAILDMTSADCPVVAAVDGTAAGGGFSIALASDHVVATPEAKFTHAYTNIGATADGGSTYFLPRVVGLQKAKELVFAPQPISAEDMADLGIVNEVLDEPFEEGARERARELADRPTEAIARSKQLLNQSLDSTLEQQLERERADMTNIVKTDDFGARVREFISDVEQ